MISIRCGIDPGRHKIGVAFAEGDTLLYSAILPASSAQRLFEAFRDEDWRLLMPWRQEGDGALLEGKDLSIVFLGNGTSCEELRDLLSEACKIEIVDERGSTLRGRELYWALHPPGGLWRLIPTSLRTPPRDIDDLAAWAIIESQSSRK